MQGGVTIGELARRSGVATSALRFYETKGLIHADRTDSGHRRYLRSALRRIAFIVFAQRVGLSLDEVAVELARLPQNRVPDAADWRKLAGGWSARIDDRIAELQRLKAGLTGCIGCGCPLPRGLRARQPRRSRRPPRAGSGHLGRHASPLIRRSWQASPVDSGGPRVPRPVRALASVRRRRSARPRRLRAESHATGRRPGPWRAASRSAGPPPQHRPP